MKLVTIEMKMMFPVSIKKTELSKQTRVKIQEQRNQRDPVNNLSRKKTIYMIYKSIKPNNKSTLKSVE